MRLGKLAFISSSLLITLSTSIPTVAQAAQNTPTPGAPPAPASIDVPDTQVQTLHVISREVVVDVMVTGKDGQPVYGLQQSDFSIEENGRHQAIRSFREYTASAPIDEPTPPKLPLGVYTNSQATPASGPVNVILLDALHSGAITMVRSLNSVSAYFSTMPEGTRVAIFWLSESGLHMMQGFTSDRETLKRALHSTTIEVGSNQERHTTDWYTIDALNQLAAYLAGIKGRKNLLWVVPGMPVDLMRDGGYGWGAQDMGMVHRLMDVYERCTVEQIAVSPIDPRGVSACLNCNLGIAQLKDEAVAEQTGGEAFYNNNDLKALITKAVDDQSHFYTLSYIPPNQKDDSRYHHIKVQTDQPAVTLVYREGYNAERVPTADAPAPGPALLKASMEGNTPRPHPVALRGRRLAHPRNPRRRAPEGPQDQTQRACLLRSPLRLPGQRDRLPRATRRPSPRLPPVRHRRLRHQPQTRRPSLPDRRSPPRAGTVRPVRNPALSPQPAHQSAARPHLAPRRYPR